MSKEVTTDAEVLKLMQDGYVLWSTHPYEGGKNFVARLEKNSVSTPIKKQQFLRLLHNDKIVITKSGTNRQYIYQINDKSPTT